jgi:hypothetical protein
MRVCGVALGAVLIAACGVTPPSSSSREQPSATGPEPQSDTSPTVEQSAPQPSVEPEPTQSAPLRVKEGDAFLGGAAGPAPPDLPAMLSRARPRLKHCYEASLATEPTIRGALRLTIRIGPNGEVLSVKSSPNSLPNDLVSCATAVFEHEHFAPPEGGGAVVDIPITFADAAH